jgi:serine/threonine-protein kinase
MAETPDRLHSALADRYPIERELGSGGMGTVYLARDLKHDRAVALKVLRPEYAAGLGTARFLREIDISAKLTHPHILPLYDSGEAEGLVYYVMPYVEGESLRDRLTREKQLPVDDAIQITRQVADALSYAHRRGIVHRDIKPENILLEEGEAVVADFGIARAITAAAGESLTSSGVVVGTAHYMSPEQGCGDEDLDARTDIYTLGCVLYEMLAGEPPFTGRTAQAVIARHVGERPPSLRVVRPEAPPWLERIVHTSLAKAPADRFPTAESFSQSLAAHAAPRFRLRAWPWAALIRARHVLAALGALVLVLAAAWYLLKRGEGAGGRVGFPTANIGVLLFQDFSQEDNSHLAAGFTDFLTKHLGGIPGLTVLSYASMRRYEEEGVALDSIVARHELGTLIEGNLIATAQQIQVSVNLTDALSRAQVASVPPLVRLRSESPALLRELADEIGRSLRPRLGFQLTRRALEAGTACGECLESVFRARALRRQAQSLVKAGDTESAAAALDAADSLLIEAESLDRDWIEPIIDQGWVAVYRAQLFTDVPQTYEAEHAGRGIAHAERALERAPSDPQGLQLRGILRSYLADSASDSTEAARLWEGAELDLARAVELDPSLAAAWSRLSLVYRERGRFHEAKRAAERALEEDVWLFNDGTIIYRLCLTSFDLEQIEEAIHWCIDEGRQRFPERSGFVSFELALLASSVGPEPDVERAWQLADTLVQVFSPHRRPATRALVLMDVAAVLARARLADSARAVIRHARDSAPQADPRLDHREANARLQLGEPEEAIRLLARFLAARPDERAKVAKDWWWRPLRERPEFRALVE